jgi:hypothetical protein
MTVHAASTLMAKRRWLDFGEKTRTSRCSSTGTRRGFEEDPSLEDSRVDKVLTRLSRVLTCRSPSAFFAAMVYPSPTGEWEDAHGPLVRAPMRLARERRAFAESGRTPAITEPAQLPDNPAITDFLSDIL